MVSKQGASQRNPKWGGGVIWLVREWQKRQEFLFRFYNQISIVFYRDPN